MGSEDFYQEEGPVHRVTVDGFWMDKFQVTNAQFALFVMETGYLTVAQRKAESQGLSRCAAGEPGARLSRLPQDTWPCQSPPH